MNCHKKEIHTKRQLIRPQLKHLEKENTKLRNEIRKLELVRWITTESTHNQRYQLQAQYDENVNEINRLYTEAKYQNRSQFDKRLDLIMTIGFPAAIFSALLVLIM